MKTVQAVRAAPDLRGGRIDLSWQNPAGSEFDAAAPFKRIRVVRRERTFPLTDKDGDLVYDGPVIAHLSDGGLIPRHFYYYTVFAGDAAAETQFSADDGSRACALATDDYGVARKLFGMLPAVYRREDAARRQLERFFASSASVFDLIRGTAEALPSLHDSARAPAGFLPALAQMVGWELDRTRPLFAQRLEAGFAPHLYRRVGTIPAIRSLVTRYSGWNAHVVEFADAIARANAAPSFNVFAIVQTAGAWRGVDDAAAVLGFDAGNARAEGTKDAPATLTGTTSEPFALRPGMQITIAGDDRPAATVRFGAADFADIAHAKASEVAAVLTRLFSQFTALDAGGRVRLVSHIASTASSVAVVSDDTSLVSLEGASHGRISAIEHLDRRWLFYAAVTGDRHYVAYKLHRERTWGAAVEVDAAQGADDPAATQLPDGRILLVWIDGPGTNVARIRFALGTPGVPHPPRLTGANTAPFVIAPGTELLFAGDAGPARGLVFAAADFANPLQARAIEVAAALNARVPGVIASTSAFGALVVESAGGADATLRVDVAGSRAAAPLGFDRRNDVATGDAGDAIVWSTAADAAGTPGWQRDPFAVTMSDGSVKLFWSAHDGTRWTIAGSTWTAGGGWSAAVPLAAGGAANREPSAAFDGAGRLWLVWSQQQSGASDTWTLRYRIFEAGVWGPEKPLTSAVADRTADREPAAVLTPLGDLRVYFHGERDHARSLWSVTVTPGTGAIGPLTRITSGVQHDRAPTPTTGPDGAAWLLYRSDRSVAPARAGVHELPLTDDRVTDPAKPVSAPANLRASTLAVDTGTLRRFAATTSAALDDAERIAQRRRAGDLLTYTPQRLLAEDVPDETDLYTRGTIGLYLTAVVPESPQSQQVIARLRGVLGRFLPVNVRAVVVLAPAVDVETVYAGGAIGETYSDKFPFIERLAPLSDASRVALPDLSLLHANAAADVSANPADLTTLRRRTFFPPPPNDF